MVNTRFTERRAEGDDLFPHLQALVLFSVFILSKQSHFYTRINVSDHCTSVISVPKSVFLTPVETVMMLPTPVKFSGLGSSRKDLQDGSFTDMAVVLFYCFVILDRILTTAVKKPLTADQTRQLTPPSTAVITHEHKVRLPVKH